MRRTSCKPRPSAANRLSRGIVYPFVFFQLEIHAGMTQFFCSSADTLRGGECMTGGGGEPGPLGTFLILYLGGSNGSEGASVIRMILVPD